MSLYKLKLLFKKALLWVVVGFVGFTGFELYQKGAFKKGFTKGVVPALAWKMRSLPVIGDYARKYAKPKAVGKKRYKRRNKRVGKKRYYKKRYKKRGYKKRGRSKRRR